MAVIQMNKSAYRSMFDSDIYLRSIVVVNAKKSKAAISVGAIIRIKVDAQLIAPNWCAQLTMHIDDGRRTTDRVLFRMVHSNLCIFIGHFNVDYCDCVVGGRAAGGRWRPQPTANIIHRHTTERIFISFFWMVDGDMDACEFAERRHHTQFSYTMDIQYMDGEIAV